MSPFWVTVSLDFRTVASGLLDKGSGQGYPSWARPPQDSPAEARGSWRRVSSPDLLHCCCPSPDSEGAASLQFPSEKIKTNQDEEKTEDLSP